MENKNKVGRPSQKDKEVLLIQIKTIDGKTKSKTYRAEKFDFGKVVECLNELLTK